MKIKTTISQLFIFIFAIFLVSCNNSAANKTEEQENEHEGEASEVLLTLKQQQAIGLKTGTFQMRNLTSVIKTNGQLEVDPGNKAEVTAIMGGNVKSINVFVGDKVKKGQILAILEHPTYITLQEDFSVASNRLEFLKQEYQRQKELYENNVGATKNYQKARAEYNVAKAKYNGLKSKLKMLNISPASVEAGNISGSINILSPIDGDVSDVNIKLGTYVATGKKMFEITNNRALHADFMIYEKDVHLVKKGQTIHFTVANNSGKEYTSKVFAIEKRFDPVSKAVHIHSKINEDTEGLIQGMYISGHLHTDKKYTRTLPNDAIVTEGTKSFIFIVEHSNNPEETAFKPVEVIPGIKDDGYTEIKLLDTLPDNTMVALNSAYYLLADMQKSETGDDD